MFLSCDLRCHVFKELCDLMGHQRLATFCGHRLCGSSDTVAKTVYMTLQDHVIEESGLLF